MSKIVTVTFGAAGERAPQEGWVILSYADPKGGQTSVGIRVMARRWTEEDEAGTRERTGPLPMWETIASDLHTQIGSQPSWPKFVKSKAEGNRIRLSVPDELNPVVFFAEFNPSLDQSARHERDPGFVKITEDAF